MQEKGSPITAYPVQNTGNMFETGGHRMENELILELPEKCGCGSENLSVWGTRIEGRVKVDVRCMRCGKILWDNK